MNRKNFSLKAKTLADYRKEGEAAFSAFYGTNDAEFSRYDGEGPYAAGQQRSAAGVGTIQAAQRSISIKITNGHATDAALVTLFGAYSQASLGNFGNPASVTITSDTIPYGQILSQSSSNPFLVRGVKMVFGGTDKIAQLNEVLTLAATDLTGRTTSQPYFPNMAFSPNQQSQDIIEDKEFEFLVDGSSSIKFNLAAQTNVKMIFFITAKTDLSRMALGKAPLSVTNAEAPLASKNPTLIVKR
ncbi:hypothetical protein SAMN05421823_11954 [Catalinimonas alkaloidigena]|uniref:Uncharacterized protein n=1 Tax=Catalinimonas alkaloidigena TaxID=1075417 RepID=A0A1G9V964_9BACT|nr:hypothetical protein [Catalinimonas alkaloidigena]SDM68606.1 hypothetical protein SAMN05421823_11954 [Catalinimonas alkaloidigena]